MIEMATVKSTIPMGCILWLLSVIFILLTTSSSEASQDFTYDDEIERNISGVLNNIMKTMDNRIRPNVNGPPVLVNISFFINSFGSISELDMDYSVDVYLRQRWQDKRLVYNADRLDDSLVVSSATIDSIWLPDIFFPNEKMGSFHFVTVPNKLMRIYPNGTVVYSVRLTLKLSCPMVLTSFPMDVQECNLKLESFGYSVSELVILWQDADPIEINDNLELPQFELTRKSVEPCKVSYKTGHFSCLKAKFELKREFGFFLLQTYIPSLLIVILSWVSFWINMDAVPARISLGVTTVLTMTTQLSGSRVLLPRVSYPKAIDVWMSMCMVFVFGALLEFAVVNVLARKTAKEKYKKTDDPADIKGEDRKDEEVNYSASNKFRAIKLHFTKRQAARVLDKISRIVFPSAFLLFNIVYWSVYGQR